MLNEQEIRDVINAGENHLRKNDTMIALFREVLDTLREIQSSKEQEYIYELRKVQEEVAYLANRLRLYGLPTPSQYEKQITALRNLLSDDEWPVAIPPECICYDDEEKIAKRASAILKLTVGQYLKDLKFLDFGCGRGQVVIEASKCETQLAVGYDPKREWKVESNEKMIFLHEFPTVVKNAPYDVVLLHDVLDHATVDPVEILTQVREVINPYGRLYVKNHPWCSRHGAHLYDKLNKAYLHLVFDEVELERMGGYSYEAMPKVTNVLETYRDWFQKSGFEIVAEIPTTCEIEDIFKYKSLAHDRMMQHWEDSTDMLKNISYEFVEYILEPMKLKEQVI